MLPALIQTDSDGNRMLKVNGVRIGFAQVGVTFDPEEAFTRARVGQFLDGPDLVEFLVIDPVTLYREKQAAAERLRRVLKHQDRLRARPRAPGGPGTLWALAPDGHVSPIHVCCPVGHAARIGRTY